MPRGKSFRRSRAAKKRMAERIRVPVDPIFATDELPYRYGTGFRYRVSEWPVSKHTGKKHKLDIPENCSGKEFILVVGASHLRHFVDKHVQIPRGRFAFGISSTPGASAAELEIELAKDVVVRTPSLVVVTAPSNNLSSSRTISEAGTEFHHYLLSVCARWPEVCVLDFPPRGDFPEELQTLLRQEYHRVAARMGIKYYSLAEHFPLHNRKLRCKDGVHLSDTDGGMEKYAELLWNVTYTHLETAKARTPPVSPKSAPPEEEVTDALSPPPKWTLVERRKKKSQPGSPEPSKGDSKRRLVQQEKVKSVFSIPLSPVLFSRAILPKMDKVVPSGSLKAPRQRRKKAAASKGNLPSQQVEAAEDVEATATSPTTPEALAVPDLRPPTEVAVVTPTTGTVKIQGELVKDQEPGDVGVTPGTSPTKADKGSVSADTQKKDQEPGDVGVTPGTSPTKADEGSVSADTLKKDQEPEVVGVTPGTSPTKADEGSVSADTLKKDQEPEVVGVTPGTSPTKADEGSVSADTLKKDQEPEVVGVTPGTSPTKADEGSVSADTLKKDKEPEVVGVTPGTSPTKADEGSVSADTLKKDKEPEVVGVTPGTSPTKADEGSVSADTLKKDKEPEVVGVTPGTSPTKGSVSADTVEEHQVVKKKRRHRRTKKGHLKTKSTKDDVSKSPVDLTCCDSDVPISGFGLDTQLETGCISEENGPSASEVSPGESVPVTLPPNIRGSFHQGSDRFLFPGFQCMGIALISLAKHSLRCVSSWRKEDLDQTLVLGDELYTDCRLCKRITAGSKMLLVPNLPKEWNIDGQKVGFEYGDCLSGVVGVDSGEFVESMAIVGLYDGLERMLAQYDTCLFTLCENTCAIIHDNGVYAVVDSHARSETGMPRALGKSVVVYFRSIQELFDHFCRLAGFYARAQKCFEVSGVVVKVAGKDVSIRKRMRSPDGRVPKVESKSPNTKGMHMAKKSKTHRPKEGDGDVLFVSHKQRVRCFSPIEEDICQSLCRKLNIQFEHFNMPHIATKSSLGAPCKNESIVADGNCFFRAISLAVSGTQKNHRKIRLSVVKELEQNPLKYKSLCCHDSSSVYEYIQKKRMRYVGSWASEVEIQVTADILGLSIFTYLDGNWLEYTCKSKTLSSQAIYLENTNRNHYEVVVCIKKSGGHGCCGVCQILNKTGYSLRDSTQARNKVNSYSNEHVQECQEKEREKFRKRYAHGSFKEDIKELRRVTYRQNTARRDKIRQMNRQKYWQQLSLRNKMKSRIIQLYRDNVLYSDKLKALSTLKYNVNKEHQERVKAYSKEKYDQDKLHQERVKAYSKEKYSQDKLHQESVKAYSKEKYSQDKPHQERVKLYSKEKYSRDKPHQEHVKAYGKQKYITDKRHQDRIKAYSKIKYDNDPLYRDQKKAQSKETYRGNLSHREKVKSESKMKYKNPNYRNKKIISSKIRYHTSENKKHIQETTKINRKQHQLKLKDFEYVAECFLTKVEKGPEYICSVCHRLFFEKSVKHCNLDNYKKDDKIFDVANKCIRDTYLHKCHSQCVSPCSIMETSRAKLWICYTCHRKIIRGCIPPESAFNNLDLDPIPEQLACLNDVEELLVSPNVALMKMVALPKGGQKGIHGPVTCVPSNITETAKLLPRSDLGGVVLPVKLKRKLTYKGYYKYRFVNTMRIKLAIQCLKIINKFFADINFNETWINTISNEDFQNLEAMDVFPDEEEGNMSNVEQQNQKPPEVDLDDELLHDQQRYCIFQDTCSLPMDLGQEILDQYLDGILNLAPTEGNNPVKLLSDRENEAKCFPYLFPFGRGMFHDKRPNRITLMRYLNNRIMHADGRFAQCLLYIFFAYYLSVLQQVVSSVSIALRKGETNNQPQDNNDLNLKESLKKMIESDSGYRFLKPIRGSPPYWAGGKRHMLAMLRKLDKPTWFCSFSSADMRWNSLINTVLRQEGRVQTAEDLERAERCEILQRNPVTAARMFDYRWRIFLKEVLMSPAHPIGEIEDYFYRIEFQQRGSPHAHVLIWIRNAPMLDKNTDEEVIAFIDQYVTCELPPENDDLYEIVTSVQQHSKNHSKSCKKNKTTCRFNFPRPPSARTFIKRERKPKCPKCHKDDKGNPQNPAMNNDAEVPCICHRTIKPERAAELVSAVKKASSSDNCPYVLPEHLFDFLGINQEVFELAYCCLGGRTHIVLQRKVNEIWINQYSRKILKLWNANMDIQYVVDPYACIVYIISYMCKSEREMGLLLANAKKEACKGNLDAKNALKKVGSVFLHNREVSAQESAYLLTGMHLKESSRKLVFIPTGENIVRMSRPLSTIEGTECEDDIWMLNIVDRYKNRPNNDEFNDMCMATFASDYRIVLNGEKCKKSIQLQNDCGYITKRTRSHAAVLDSMRPTKTKNPDLYYRVMIELYVPYRTDLKPDTCPSFLLFYKNGKVEFSDGSIHSVRSLIKLNKSKFEVIKEDVDKLEKEVDCDEILESGWASLCPEQESERLECLSEIEQQQVQNPEEDEPLGIPELAVRHEEVSHIESRNNILSRQEGLALVRSLNEQQMAIFYKIRAWCLNKVAGTNPEPFYVFITGGAGTGKSHLIRAIQYEAMRLLAPMCQDPDSISVLVTAPTGIAAYNLNVATIHTTFNIPPRISLPYTNLGEEKLNSLRLKYKDLQILIIDEISMVGHMLLIYIHFRLRQIKATGDLSPPFGNVCVIAVGDFYQLPPCQGRALYKDIDVGVNFWANFSFVELTTIMRQKDEEFAQLLNRLRTRSRRSPMLNADIQLLKQCETGEESEALHIFPRNRQVDNFNFLKLLQTCPDFVTINAQDYGLNKKTGQVEARTVPFTQTEYTCLPDEVSLGSGARVMLCKNIDVNDGLVNGLCGTVMDIIWSDKELPVAIYVLFDDTVPGTQRRKRYRHPSPALSGCTRIELEEERANKQGGIRRQFPLKLAWACTVHKVQGISLDTAVVSLDQIDFPGQAYVSLSRVRTLSGLIIQDFNEKAIYCNDDVKFALHHMPPFLTESVSRPICDEPVFVLFLMNVQGLARHVTDLTQCTQLWQPNCIAVTETWLSAGSYLDTVQIDGFLFHSRSRSDSYSCSTHPALVELCSQQHGGVGMYCDVNGPYDVTVPHIDLECITYHNLAFNILVVVIYRPPSYAMSLLMKNMRRLFDWLGSKSDTVVIVGDFNDDILKSSKLSKFMIERGYIQYVESPTTERGTLIDHVYVKTTHFQVQSMVVPTYFSDHEGIACFFKYVTD